MATITSLPPAATPLTGTEVVVADQLVAGVLTTVKVSLSEISAGVLPQSPNTILAGPVSGVAALPAFRTLADADLASTSAALTGAAYITFTGEVTINGTCGALNMNGDGSTLNRIYDDSNNALAIRTGTSSSTNYFVFGSTGVFEARSGGGQFACPITNDIGTVAAYSDVAPSAWAFGASPATYQNTNAYGVFINIFGVTAAGTIVKISKDNSTFFTVANSGCYVPPGFYLQLTYSTTPLGATIIPM